MNRDPFAIRLALLTLAVVVVVLAFETAPALRHRLLPVDVEPRVVTPRGDLAGDEAATIALFNATRDSVVSISTSERVVDYFTRNAYDVPRGTGSGFVWDAAGHIVTNAHVIAGASSATVRLADGRAVRARLVGADPSHDLAVLRVDVPPSALPPLAVGTSADLQVGQTVFAIGNPFGLDWTLTRGIISALERELPNERGGVIRGLVQTDAAINPGNSGGPLIDSAGRLIGVNTAIYSPSGSNAGIGFAVPVDTVNRVVPQILARGRYRPPLLGVSTDLRADELLRRSGGRGVLVLSVEPGTPAALAGLEGAQIRPDGSIVAGDVIVGFDGARIETTSDLRAALDQHAAGDRVRVEITNGGQRRMVEVTLAEAP